MCHRNTANAWATMLNQTDMPARECGASAPLLIQATFNSPESETSTVCGGLSAASGNHLV